MHAKTTIFANGTPCCRAPELLNENPTYTNKVDIWALGCILYELFFETKTFASDWNVNEYRISKSPQTPIPPTETPEVLETHVSVMLHELLDIQ